jgi:FkbM family methyltransferase
MGNKSIISNLTFGIIKKINKLFYNPFQKVGLNWVNVRILKNLPDQQEHSISFLNSKISFYSRDEFIHSLDEIFISEIYKQSLKNEPFIIDCGANIGLSVIYMKHLYPNAKIIAFEPDDRNFELLHKNVSSFGLTNVELRKEAIWIENTTLHFISEGSLMSKIQEAGISKNTIEVKATRLKDLMIQPIDFLKIDIEGAEYKVLKDIEEKLPLVKSLFLEYHGTFDQNEELNDILNTITQSGFRYYLREAIDKHPTPFMRKPTPDYDVQLNIFCFR